MNIAVVIFPGSNCDHDVLHLYGRVLRRRVRAVWHRETDLGKPDLVVLPGGFSYGDYLRTGAMAKLSPIMSEVTRFAQRGGPVLGICNGFQILCEAGLLPGALLRNEGLRFCSRFIHMRVESESTPFTKRYPAGAIITCPVAHGEGNYFADEDTLHALEDQGQVIFRYCTPSGDITPQSNPNGSAHSIAGICNTARNVVGLMPHPERASEGLVGGPGESSGRLVFESALG